jgi:hypothetical protein
MRTATATIRSLMDQISQGALRLPEIQRAYVWKPAQVAGLVDSLYRRYPSGSILLWETTETVTEKDMATAATGSPVFVTKPLYLLDGQQRLTSLHRVFSGHERAQVVFNPLTEKFQIESAATRKDRRWVAVRGLLAGTSSTFSMVGELAEVVPELTAEELHHRLERVRRIGEYSYYLEILDDLPYPEVTEVFVRVNSRGRALKDTDLALATLSARWPGVVAKVDALVEECRERRYQALDTSFVVRALAALATETTSPGAFASTSIARLEESWTELERGVRHTIDLLTAEVGIDNTTLLPSANALVPIVYYLAHRPDSPLTADERNALVYWLLVSFVQSRYSASAATVIAQDVGALRSEQGLLGLYSNLGLLNTRLQVSPASLAGKGSTSPYFLLSYLAARRNQARDWWYGSPVALSHDGTYKVEYHHVHPRARLSSSYSKAEINDLANLVFISDKANRKISSRPPAVYFEELLASDATNLAGHLVPEDPELRTVEAYPNFIARRREALADAMNTMLDQYCPDFLKSGTATAPVDEQIAVSVEAYGTSLEADDIMLVIRATHHGDAFEEHVPYAALDSALRDLEDGRGAEIELGGFTVPIAADAELVEIPFGPVLLQGTLTEWRRVLDRELGELFELADLPVPPIAATWEGPRHPLNVLDTE